MFLTAYLDGQKVDLTRTPVEQILTWHEDGQLFEMPDGCKKLGRIRRSFYGRWAFAHPPKSNCRGESPDHFEAKGRLAELCRMHLPADDVDVEFLVPGHPQKIDVTATTAGGVKWALEVQRSGQPPDKTHDRTRVLNRLGYMVAWFFFRPGQMAGLHDTPSAIHLLTDKDITAVRRKPGATTGRVRPEELVPIAGPDVVSRLLAGELAWLPRTTFTHARRGIGKASTFTCRCGTKGAYPLQAPPCRHSAACGFDVGPAEGCPDFDWPKHLWKNPSLLPSDIPLGICFRTRRGTWSRCQGCKKNIRAKPGGPWREPERRKLDVPISLAPSDVGQATFGHWCGLAGTRCHQAATATRPVAKGQAKLFSD